MKNWLVLPAVLLLGMNTRAQLADGSTAPDFTLTDINGNTHHLYDYLDAGKTVVIDFFAAHCPTCWAYHNTHAVRDFYAAHGPGGTLSQDAVVMAIEFDAGNGTNELYGISGVTQGDWVTGTPYPIVNPEGADRDSVLGSYAVWFYPMVYRICPDKKVLYIGTPTAADLASHLEYCTLTALPGQAAAAPEQVYLDFSQGRLYYRGLDVAARYQMSLYNARGQRIWAQEVMTEGSVWLQGTLPAGGYVYVLEKNGLPCRRGKLVLQ